MAIAIVSDIHGNIEALEAVMADIKDRGIKKIYCLGDIVGYGPKPAECLRIAMDKFDLILQGNHEWGIFNEVEMYFNSIAVEGIYHSRNELNEKELSFIKELKPGKLFAPQLFVHGSVRNPLMDYVRDVTEDGHEGYMKLIATIREDFNGFDTCFVGHNHKPFLGTEYGVIHPHEGMNKFQTIGQKAYVCVGSVGQPRDRDPRSCYVIFDGNQVEYVRVKYDVTITSNQILQAGLPEFLASRILQGI